MSRRPWCCARLERVSGYSHQQLKGLRAIDVAHLFPSSTKRIGIRRGAWLRGYAYVFIELFAPHLSRKTVEAALRGGEGDDPGL